MIRTKSVYDTPEDSDGKRFMVTRYWPRGISKQKLKITGWIRELAPGKELLRDWKNNAVSWQEYETRYFREMESKRQFIRQLADIAAAETITLLCFEKEDNPHCHRHLLKQLIEKQLK